ncbi:helix-turn-helix transcriptional regulator [Streptomyces sp. NPDC005963]|uniref:helix-turn-helix domain-containing protein n=1 Tax=Streptomyces sp. NPDC005963 TaxID=3156721 RepID=UPI0033CC721A
MSAEHSHSEAPIAPVTELRPPKPNPRARPLGAGLRGLRKAQGRSLAEAAKKAFDGSASKLSRMERAQSPVVESDMWNLIRFYETPQERWPEFYDLWRQAQPDSGERPVSDVAPDWLHRLIVLEQTASRIMAYEPLVVPGLLQTPAYARALVRAELARPKRELDAMTVERHVLVRRERWEAFQKQEDCELVVILGEGVLRSLIGDIAVMYEQVKHLRDAADLPHVSIHIIPYDRDGLSRAPSLPVTHLKWEDGGPPELLYVEGLNRADYIDDPDEVQEGRFRVESAMHVAHMRKGSIALLDQFVAMYAKLLGERRAQEQ